MLIYIYFLFYYILFDMDITITLDEPFEFDKIDWLYHVTKWFK